MGSGWGGFDCVCVLGGGWWWWGVCGGWGSCLLGMLCHRGFKIKLFEILVFDVTGYSLLKKKNKSIFNAFVFLRFAFEMKKEVFSKSLFCFVFSKKCVGERRVLG